MPTSDFPSLFGAFHSEILHCRVCQILESGGFRLVRWPPTGLSDLPEAAGPILAELGPAKESHFPPILPPLGRDDLGPWIGVILSDRQDRPRRAGAEPRPPGFDLELGLPTARTALLSAVRWGWVTALERKILLAIHGTPGLHAGLRASLRQIVRQRPDMGKASESGPLEDAGFREAQGTLSKLAFRAGVSSGHLSLLARRHSLDLKRMDDHWRVVLAVALRMEEGSWERAAWRLGYSGGAGMTALVQRTIGCRPTDLEKTPAFGLERIGRGLVVMVTRSTGASHLGKPGSARAPN